jgi:hypothetical protein
VDNLFIMNAMRFQSIFGERFGAIDASRAALLLRSGSGSL